MRVLHFRSSFTFAGPEAVLLNLAAPLGHFGVETAVIAHYQHKPGEPVRHRLVEEIKRLGLQASQWDEGTFISPRVTGRLVQELVSGRFDILHTHDPKANLVGLVAAHQARVPIVGTVHLHDTSGPKSRMFRAMDLQILRFFPQIIAVSHAVREELIAARLPAERIRVIHNGIDSSRFSQGAAARASAWRTRQGCGERVKIVTTVGRLSPQKGIHVFLQAALLILRERPGIRFWVVGSGPLRRELEETARSLGIDGAVCFHGHQSDIAAIMASSDVIAVTSRREGLPMVVLEAMALARPVVATEVGGIPEIIRDGVTGWLGPAGEAPLIAQRILYAVDHPGEASAVGERGRRRVATRFAAQESARRHAQIYSELLGARARVKTMAVGNELG